MRDEGSRKLYRGRAVHDALVQKALKKQVPLEDEELLGGSDSPNLERLRLAKAKREEILLAQLSRTLLPRDEVRESLAAALYPLRNAGERLQREHGLKAFEILDQALGETERAVDDYFARVAADAEAVGV